MTITDNTKTYAMQAFKAYDALNSKLKVYDGPLAFAGRQILTFGAFLAVILEAIVKGVFVFPPQMVVRKWDEEKALAIQGIREGTVVLKSLSWFLRNEKEVVLEAVRKNGFDLRWASDKLRDDKEVVSAAVEENGMALQFASQAMCIDEEVVLKAVSNNGMALMFAQQCCRNIPEIVSAAVGQNGLALQLAYPRLQDDEAIVRKAIGQNGTAIRFASPRVHESLFLEALENNPNALEFARSFRDKDNFREIVLETVKKEGRTIEFAKKFWNDREILLAAVSQNGLALEHVLPALKDQPDLRREVVLAAIEQNIEVIYLLRSEIINDPDIVAAFKSRITDVSHLWIAIYVANKSRSFALELIHENVDYFSYLSLERQRDPEISSIHAMKTGRGLFQNLTQYSRELMASNSLYTLLCRLESHRAYENVASRPLFLERVKQVLDFCRSHQDTPVVREIEEVAANISTECADRGMTLLNKIETLVQSHQESNSQVLADVLIAKKRQELLEAFILEDFVENKENVEVVLWAGLSLNERLNLRIANQGMKYGEFLLTSIFKNNKKAQKKALDKWEAGVLKQTATPEQKRAILLQNPVWVDRIKQEHAAEFEAWRETTQGADSELMPFILPDLSATLSDGAMALLRTMGFKESEINEMRESRKEWLNVSILKRVQNADHLLEHYTDAILSS